MTDCNVPNRTIFCKDNLEVLRGINSDCIDLIYLDPPFNKNKQFTAPIGSSAEGAGFSDIFREEDVKAEWLITIKEDHPELYNSLTLRSASTTHAKTTNPSNKTSNWSKREQTRRELLSLRYRSSASLRCRNPFRPCSPGAMRWLLGGTMGWKPRRAVSPRLHRRGP